MQTAQILNYNIDNTKEARFDTKLNVGLKEMLKRASVLEGVDLSAFIISAATQKARNIIINNESLKLNNIEYQNFLSLIQTPPKANEELKTLLNQDNFDER